MNKWMKTYWRTRTQANFSGWGDERIREFEYAKRNNDYVSMVRIFPHTFKTLENPSEEVQIAAVSQNGNVIRQIKKPSEKVQLAAVTQTGHAIRDIYKNGIKPSTNVQLTAVQQNIQSAMWIPNPSKKVKDYLKSKGYDRRGNKI